MLDRIDSGRTHGKIHNKMPQTQEAQTYYMHAYPKINIALKIGEKRGNLHTLQSRFCLLHNGTYKDNLPSASSNSGLYDRIFLVSSPPDSLFLDSISFHACNTLSPHFSVYKEQEKAYSHIAFSLLGNFDCALKDNLIYKAYTTLLKHNHNKKEIKPCDLHIMVEKHIPVGGGLGGGSSNAALLLVALNEALELNYNRATLLECAKELGSDVAFFVVIYTQNSANLAPYFFTKSKKEVQHIAHIIESFCKNKNLDSMDRALLCNGLQENFEENLQHKKPQFLSANVSGIGDIVEPFYEELPRFTLHKPQISCNTASVYKEFARLKNLLSQDSQNMLDSKKSVDSKTRNSYNTNENLESQKKFLGQFQKSLQTHIDFTKDSVYLLKNHSMQELNDLYLPACNLYPLGPIAKELQKQYTQIYFSGSGSSFFSKENEIQ